MTHTALALSFLLATVFAFAAASKLSDLPGTRAAAVRQGVPDSLAAPVGVLVAALELGAAVLLLAAPHYGALAALGLLAVFSGVLALAWARGRDEDCGCFGPFLNVRPGPALARNGALAALSAVVVAGPAVSGLDLLAATLVAAGIGSCALAASQIASRRAARPPLSNVLSPSSPAEPTTAPAASRRQAIGAAATAGAAAWLGGLAGSRTEPASGIDILTGLACDVVVGGCCCACTCTRTASGIVCNCGCAGCRGIAGGGTLATATGTASFSVFASAMAFPVRKRKKPEPVVLGSLQWSDPGAGISLKSTRIDQYGPVGTSKTTRRVKGIAEAKGHGRLPFVLTTNDGGGPGSGADTVDLKLGAAAGGSGTFTYSAAGPLTAGDIHGLNVELFKPRKSSK